MDEGRFFGGSRNKEKLEAEALERETAALEVLLTSLVTDIKRLAEDSGVKGFEDVSLIKDYLQEYPEELRDAGNVLGATLFTSLGEELESSRAFHDFGHKVRINFLDMRLRLVQEISEEKRKDLAGRAIVAELRIAALVDKLGGEKFFGLRTRQESLRHIAIYAIESYNTSVPRKWKIAGAQPNTYDPKIADDFTERLGEALEQSGHVVDDSRLAEQERLAFVKFFKDFPDPHALTALLVGQDPTKLKT